MPFPCCRRIAAVAALALLGCNADLERKQRELDERIAALDAKMATLSRETEGLRETVDQHSTVVEALEDSVGTLEGSLTDRVTTLESTVGDHKEKLTDIDTRLHQQQQETLFVWDGDGRYLGLLLGATASAVVFVDPGTGSLVQAVIASTGTPIYFSNADCTGRAFFQSPVIPPLAGSALLDQSTGEVLRYKRWETEPVVVRSQRDPAGIGPCAPADGYTGGHEWEHAYALSPFTQRVYVAQAQW